jgi:LPS export ABC transporter protein LptC
MPRPARNLLIFIVLAGIAGASWLLSRPPAEAPARLAPEAGEPLGFYLRDAVLIGTDAEGRVSYRIYADRVEQIEAEDDLVLDEVRVEYDTSEQVPWRLTAKQGTAAIGGEYLELFGGVRLANDPDEGIVPTVVETQQLRLDPASFVASSDQSVVFRRGSARITAVGFRANLKDGQLDLESQGYGQFGD